MLNLSKIMFVLSMVLGLGACQSMQSTAQPEDISKAPEALKFTAQAHPLGLGKRPDSRTAGYAYLLLGDLPEQDMSRAKTACQALFNSAESSKPTVALSDAHLVTYLPVNKAGDYRRVSSRFKWSMCKYLASLSDQEREFEILSELGYAESRGPLLVVFNQPYKAVSGDKKAIVVDLSKVPEAELPLVLKNWKENVAPEYALWKRGADLSRLHARLNEGLSNIRIAISTQPEVLEFNTALSQHSQMEEMTVSPL